MQACAKTHVHHTGLKRDMHVGFLEIGDAYETDRIR